MYFLFFRISIYINERWCKHFTRRCLLLSVTPTILAPAEVGVICREKLLLQLRYGFINRNASLLGLFGVHFETISHANTQSIYAKHLKGFQITTKLTQVKTWLYSNKTVKERAFIYTFCIVHNNKCVFIRFWLFILHGYCFIFNLTITAIILV